MFVGLYEKSPCLLIVVRLYIRFSELPARFHSNALELADSMRGCDRSDAHEA